MSRRDQEEGWWCWTLKRAQERSRAGRWSWVQKVGLLFASVVPQQLCCGQCLCDCSAQQSKQQLAEYTNCFAMARSPLPKHSCCSGGGPRPPRSFEDRSARTSHSLSSQSPPPPPPLLPVPNKPYGFCGRKATYLLTYLEFYDKSSKMQWPVSG